MNVPPLLVKVDTVSVFPAPLKPKLPLLSETLEVSEICSDPAMTRLPPPMTMFGDVTAVLIPAFPSCVAPALKFAVGLAMDPLPLTDTAEPLPDWVNVVVLITDSTLRVPAAF